MVIRKFRELEIWQEAMEICEDVYRLTDKYPKHEQYGLVSQMRRASVSLPSNIAEGFVRKHTKEFRHFLSIVLGSLAELDTQLILSARLSYVSCEESDWMLEKTDRLGRKTSNFIARMRK